ncbi:hypothetical protein MRB53_029945 [Persea americana]|uniref:Uncharacterized protein n=1 Tax=Persea americana TaxID=3435 RepID=A0ACC2KJT7_PERAE|nr:hypothetical protein MRB53_029945 [Persea americana]
MFSSFAPSLLVTTNPKPSSIVSCKRVDERGFSFNYSQKPLKKKIRTVRSFPIMNPTAAISASAASSSSSMMLTSGASTRVGALLSVRVLKSVLAVMHVILLLLLLPFRQRRREERRKGAVSRVASLRRSVAVDLDVGTRRAIAVGRVGKDGDERTVREWSLFATSRGETMFAQSWMPVSGKIRGLVVLLHGLNEHSGRYNDFAKQLNANGYKVYGMDWTGHGGSNGLHGYVHSLDEAVSDTKEFLEKVLAENPGLPCFLFGHSTGGAIILKAVLDPKIEVLVEGIVLTSPAIRVQPSHPIVGVIAPIFSFFLPKYQFSAANKQGLPVSRDPDALVAKYSDPLVYTGSIRVRTGYEILCISSYLQRNLSRVQVPFLVLHGTADTTTDPEASKKLYEEACTAEKSIKLYEGYLHDLLFEPERVEIMEDIIDWLNSKLNV